MIKVVEKSGRKTTPTSSYAVADTIRVLAAQAERLATLFDTTAE